MKTAVTSYSIFLLATSEASHSRSVMDAMPHLAGMLMVMVTLTFLWGVCALTAKLVAILQPEIKAAAAVATTATTSPNPTALDDTDSSSVSPEMVAVIAAAVATVMGHKSVRIISIKPMSTNWERSGRQSIFTSHRIR